MYYRFVKVMLLKIKSEEIEIFVFCNSSLRTNIPYSI